MEFGILKKCRFAELLRQLLNYLQRKFKKSWKKEKEKLKDNLVEDKTKNWKREEVSLNLKNHEEEQTYWTVSGHFVHIFFCCCTSPGILPAGQTVIMILWLGSSVSKYVCIKRLAHFICISKSTISNLT